MGKINWSLLGNLGGMSLMSAALGGLIVYDVMKQKISETEESQKSIAQHFQTASAADRLEAIRRGMVFFKCYDKATGLVYTIEHLEEDDVTDEGLEESGCKIFGKSSVILAPAFSPASVPSP